jgi:hypothetical protein
VAREVWWWSTSMLLPAGPITLPLQAQPLESGRIQRHH